MFRRDPGLGERRGVSPTWKRFHVGLTPRRSPRNPRRAYASTLAKKSTSGLRSDARQALRTLRRFELFHLVRPAVAVSVAAIAQRHLVQPFAGGRRIVAGDTGATEPVVGQADRSRDRFER